MCPELFSQSCLVDFVSPSSLLCIWPRFPPISCRIKALSWTRQRLGPTSQPCPSGSPALYDPCLWHWHICDPWSPKCHPGTPLRCLGWAALPFGGLALLPPTSISKRASSPELENQNVITFPHPSSSPQMRFLRVLSAVVKFIAIIRNAVNITDSRELQITKL